MTELIIVALAAFIDVLIFMSLVFLYARRRKRYDLIDVAWGPAFVIVALFGFAWSSKNGTQWLVTALILLWGIRIALHIGRRWLRAVNEDARYVELRKKWRGDVAVNTYFRVYIVQALLVIIISTPLLLVYTEAQSANAVMVTIGCLVWLAGLATQAIADRQLALFTQKASNRGKLMKTGLWRYSRHPNYFGEIVMWWAMFIISYAATGSWLGVIGALTITYLIMRISGVPPSERRLELKPGWKQYKAQTSVLIPLPPKN